MIALIDGDIVTYRVGWASNEDPVGIAIARLHKMIENILADTDSGADFRVYLTPTNHSNFRFTVYPEYKANRPDKKPVWYKELRIILTDEYGAELAEGMEADDLLGINQTDETIICSIDKDLDQIAGAHYDFVKEVEYQVSPEDALRFFYFQLLTGDSTDNVPGVMKIGPKKAEKILDGIHQEVDFQKICLKEYEKAYGEDGFVTMLQYGRVLRIKQHINEHLWYPQCLDAA